MKKKIFATFFLIVINFNLYADENNKSIRIGLLAPLTGTYSELGNSLLYSLQLALEEINDENVIIVPRDSGLNEKEKLNKAINEIKSNNVKVVSVSSATIQLEPLYFRILFVAAPVTSTSVNAPNVVAPNVNPPTVLST